MKLVKAQALGSALPHVGEKHQRGNEEEADSSSEAACFMPAQRNALCLPRCSELLTHVEHVSFAPAVDFLCVAHGTVSSGGTGG